MSVPVPQQSHAKMLHMRPLYVLPLLALLLAGCPKTATQPQPTPTPPPECLTVRLTLKDKTLILTATDPAALVAPLVRVLVAGVPGGLTGEGGVRLPEAGLYLQFRPDLTVQEDAPEGWRTCPTP